MAQFLTYQMLGRHGRLGNQLWQIASTLGIAHARKMEARFPNWEYQPYFRVPPQLFENRLPPDREDLGRNFLQELRYFADIEHQVRAWFQPATRIMERLHCEFPEVLSAPHTTAVHIRRGDYVSQPNHHPLLPIQYYWRAADRIVTEHPDTLFVFFGDDDAWADMSDLYEVLQHRIVFPRAGLPRPDNRVERRKAGPPTDQLDLFLMMLCDRHIIANSSFSWWAAFLSNDEAPIYPSRWFGPAYAGIPWRAMFDQRWIEIDASS